MLHWARTARSGVSAGADERASSGPVYLGLFFVAGCEGGAEVVAEVREVCEERFRFRGEGLAGAAGSVFQGDLVCLDGVKDGEEAGDFYG